MRALVTSPGAAQGVVIDRVDNPRPDGHEAVVAVRAVSVNGGELRGLGPGSASDQRLGWDLTGVVTAPARDGSGPPVGSRVIGLLQAGAWAELAAVPTNALTALPDEVDDLTAATLPLSGVTALRVLRLAAGGTAARRQRAAVPDAENNKMWSGRRVAVSAVTGGPGGMVAQLAAAAGAEVTAVVSRAAHSSTATELGAARVAVGPDGVRAERDTRGGFDAAFDAVGGEVLGALLEAVAPQGTVVSYGNASRQATTFSVDRFFVPDATSLLGYLSWTDFPTNPIPLAHDLAELARAAAEGRLRPLIAATHPWQDYERALAAAARRDAPGKVVLTIDAAQQ